jgi:hypothetical protein
VFLRILSFTAFAKSGRAQFAESRVHGWVMLSLRSILRGAQMQWVSVPVIGARSLRLRSGSLFETPLAGTAPVGLTIDSR